MNGERRHKSVKLTTGDERSREVQARIRRQYKKKCEALRGHLMNDLRERSDVENVLGRVEDWSEIVCGTDMNWNDPQTLSYLLALEEEIREEALWELFEQGRNPDWEEYFYSLNH